MLQSLDRIHSRSPAIDITRTRRNTRWRGASPLHLVGPFFVGIRKQLSDSREDSTARRMVW